MPFIHIKWTQVELFKCSARWTCSAEQQLKNVRLEEAHQCRARSKTLRSSRKTLHTQLQKTTVSTKHLNFTASPSNTSQYKFILFPFVNDSTTATCATFKVQVIACFGKAIDPKTDSQKKLWRRQDHRQYFQAHRIWIPTRCVLRAGHHVYYISCLFCWKINPTFSFTQQLYILYILQQ